MLKYMVQVFPRFRDAKARVLTKSASRSKLDKGIRNNHLWTERYILSYGVVSRLECKYKTLMHASTRP